MNKIKLISLLAAAAVMTGSVAMAETYSATGNGYHGEMTVNVTIEDGKITDVELGDNHETNVVIDRAFPVIRERILEANTADVDSVTAATFSSYAIKTAVGCHAERGEDRDGARGGELRYRDRRRRPCGSGGCGQRQADQRG